MEMGIGQGKTEALSFLAGDAPEPRLELRHGTQVVPWGTSYRYLGFVTCTDLSEHVMIERLLERLRSGFYRYFTRNEILRRSPVATQLQVYRTTTLVATEYLRCILSLSSSVCAKLDTECKRVARAILCVPATAANALTWGTAPAPRPVARSPTGRTPQQRIATEPPSPAPSSWRPPATRTSAAWHTFPRARTPTQSSSASWTSTCAGGTAPSRRPRQCTCCRRGPQAWDLPHTPATSHWAWRTTRRC
jgi:hypothetical protein